MRLLGLVGGVAVSFAAIGFPMPARACGGGVVTTTTEGTVADAQRIVVSVHDGVTDVITQIGVPDTTADYGALLPVPSEPTLDSEPVSAEELEALDAETRPIIQTYSSSGGGEDSGCSCGDDVKSNASRGGGAPIGPDVSRPVQIGPVTAVALTADDGDAVRAWLGDNEFAIPDEHAALIDAYAGPGRYFIAIRRSANATMGGPTSIGVHFTLAEEHGELPLRFARLGAAETVAFSVFVAAGDIVRPAAPFVTRDLYDLELDLLRGSYAEAVAEASNRDGELAFVIEGAYRLTELSGKVGPSIEALLGSGNRQLTRLTTVLPNDALTDDAHFTETYDTEPPRRRSVGLSMDPSAASAAALWLALLLRRPRTRRVARRPRRGSARAMSGKARGRAGTIALGVALLLSCAVGCDTSEVSHDCRDLCEHVASLECADPVDACVSDCRDAEAELPAACEDEWQAVLDCATEADFSCDPTPCDPTRLEACPSGPQIQGCDDEIDAFGDCDPADDCAIADGSGSSLTPDGQSAEYLYTSLCDRCPSSPGGGIPGPCAGPEDCEVVCCDCTDISFTAQMCIDGRCADSDEVCDASFGVCSLF